MIIGVPKEIKTNENRVALVPAGAEALVGGRATPCCVEQGAGLGQRVRRRGLRRGRGARSSPRPTRSGRKAEMIMKVKEPIAVEWPRMRKGQVIYTYFHFAAAEELTRAVIESGAIAVAYETVQLPERRAAAADADVARWPAGWRCRRAPSTWRRSSAAAASCWAACPGVAPGEVVIIGGGVVGINAAKMAAGLGAHVTILDISLDRLRYLDDVLPANVDTALLQPPQHPRAHHAGPTW